MFKSLVPLALLSAFALPGALAFSVDTPPQLVQCQPVKIEWSGASAGPIDIIFVDPKKPCDSVLADLGTNNTGTSRTWTVDMKAGTSTQVSLLDSDGAEAWSGVVTVGGGSDTSCLAGHSSSTTPSSTSTGSTETPTTLVVPAANAAKSAPPTSSTPGAVPVGAANAGLNPSGDSESNGASAFAVLSAPVIGLSTLVALFVSTAF